MDECFRIISVLLLSLIIYALLPTVSHSQAPSSVGAHIGISNSWLRNTSERIKIVNESTPSVLGMNAMILTEWNLTPNLGIQLGIGYAERGFGRKFDLVSFFGLDENRINKRFVEVKSYLNYTSFRMNTKYKHHFEKWSPYIWIGPSVDILVHRDDEEIQFLFDGEPGNFNVAYTPLFDELFWSLSLGTGVQYDISRNLRMSFDFGYIGEIGHSQGNKPYVLRSIRGVDTRIGLTYVFEH